VRIAALDLGSNSFHLVVAETTPGVEGSQIRVIDSAVEMVGLGEATLVSGTIPTERFGRGLEALAALRRRAEEHRPEAFLVVATSAIREASNGIEFVRAGRKVAGTNIRVIDGHEEARLIYFGARGALRLGGRRVALFDLGGGSLELIVAGEHGILLTASHKMGVLRLKEQWLGPGPHDVVGAETLARLREAVQEGVRPLVASAQNVGFDFVAFTAGTARALRTLADARSPGATPSTSLALVSLSRLEAELAKLPARERAVLPGVDQKRADTLLPGAVVLRTILELGGHAEATYCEAALREGMIAAYLEGSW
jgi:exopolyphosphatase/guanosine-5'-triphosphate,3'-diphosphate pyrophosphatase